MMFYLFAHGVGQARFGPFRDEGPLDFGEEFKQGDHRLGLIVPFTLEAEAFPVSAHLPPSACRSSAHSPIAPKTKPLRKN